MRPDQPRFPEGVIKSGCEYLGGMLQRVPLVEDYTWMGSDFRFWHARFAIRCRAPLCWGVVRRLGYALNTSVPEIWRCKPFVFYPDGDEGMYGVNKEVVYWVIEAIEPMLDPKEVADHLDMMVLSQIRTENDWLEY